jgi:hypothetical protein
VGLRIVGTMTSYVGPARLVVDGTEHDVAVNLQSFVNLAFVDLSEAPMPVAEGWRGVVVDAGFVPPTDGVRSAEVRLPDGRGATGVLSDRRLEGTGRGPLA